MTSVSLRVIDMTGITRRVVAAFGLVAIIGATAVVPLGPVAQAADLGGGVVTGMEIDGNKTLEGAGPAFDWASFQPNPLGSGPTGTTPGYVIGAGIVSAGVVQSNYAIDGANLATACGQGSDATPISGKVNDNPWSNSAPSNVAGKDDICSGGNALEVVNVSGQLHYVLYSYYTRTPTATGAETVLQVLYGANPGRCDDMIVDVDFDPLTSVTFMLLTWQPTANDGCANPNGSGHWTAAAPTAGQMAAFKGATGQNTELVDPSGQGTFGETAIDLTLLGSTVSSGIVPEDSCVSLTTGPLITYDASDVQSSLKDILNPVPITIDNCSEISITKATSPAGVTGVPFNYTLDQTDSQAVHDGTLAETNGLGQLPQADATAITSDINAGDTHHWVNVIAQPDYRLAESSLPAGWTLAQFSCTFYDPFFVVNGVVSPQQRTITATFQAATSGNLGGFAIPPAMLDGGVKTSCTITNATSAVKIVKAGTGAPGQPFSFSATGQSVAQLRIGDSLTYAYAPGTAFTVTETLPATTPAWVLNTLSCVDPLGLPGNLQLDVPNKSISATTQAGHLLTCTFFNNQLAGLTVTKIASGVATDFDWGPFDVTLSSGDGGTFTGSDTQGISGTGPKTGTSVAGWTDLIVGKHYTIAETTAAGWTSDITCDGVTDTDPATAGFQFVAASSQVLVCTATNAATAGAVTLAKTVSGVDPSLAWGPVHFTMFGDSFTGNATQSISGSGNGASATTAHWGGLVAGGTYTITEMPVPGFTTVLGCTGVTDQDAVDSSVTFTATLGQQISCSATNHALPASLVLDKSVSGVTAGYAWGPLGFTLSGGSFTGAATQPISGIGNGVSATTASWAALVPGNSYTLTEAAQNWVSTIWCNVPDTDAAGNVVKFVAPIGTQVSCSAYNTTAPVDLDAPVVSDLRVLIREGGRLRSAPILVAWTATDNVTPAAGLTNKVVKRRFIDGHWTWRTIATTSAQQLNKRLSFNRLFMFLVRARDADGNWSAWAQSDTISLLLRQERHFTLQGPWTIVGDPYASGDHLAATSAAGARATLAFSGDGAALVMPTGAGLGTIEACVDPGTASEQCRTINLATFSPTGNQRVVGAFNGLTAGAHTLRLTVVNGTVKLDGAVISQ